MRNPTKTIASGLVVLLLISTSAPTQEFSGSFKFKWLDSPDSNHREMEVLEAVSFKSANGKKWHVPEKTIIDGASIPKILWSFVGSPFVGKYRRASVIHDHYCDNGTEQQSEVHLMFKEAMLTDGASSWEANTKYAAVKFAALCPKKDGVISFEFKSAIQTRPDIFSQQTIEQIIGQKDGSESSGAKFEIDKQVSRDSLNDREQLIFDKLLNLKASTTEESLLSLESILRDVPIEDQRFNDLTLLVETIYPKDFK